MEIDRHRIILPKALKDSGKHEVEIKLHHDVTATVSVTIAPKTPVEAPKPEVEEGPKTEKTVGGFKSKAKAKHKE